MDRRLILAVAGSGKTTFLINQLDEKRRFLIVTYTQNNLAHIRESIIEKYGSVPHNITIKSYFQFLIQDCYRPFLKYNYRASGICWKQPSEETMRFSRNSRDFYLTNGGSLYHNRIAKMCQQFCCTTKIKQRLEKFYDVFMVDEAQDLGGHDFNLMLDILPNIDCLLVGDFYQNTFDTSRDGNTNVHLYNNYAKYKKLWEKAGILVDETLLNTSYRCSPQTCDFVRENLQIDIFSYREDNTMVKWVDNQEEADSLYYNNTIVKLFYEDSVKYDCYSENWGKSKGIDRFNDVCVVLNARTFDAFQKQKVAELSSSTKNKLYVACTRAKGNIYLVSDKFYKKYKQGIFAKS